MKDYQRLQHTVWECKYLLVFIPKYRRKALFTALRQDLGPVFRDLARRKGCRVEEGHWRAAQVHRLVSIPPQYAVAALVGYLKGKRAMHIART
jgi:putative transposase